MALAVAGALGRYRYEHMTVLQQLYLRSYLQSQIAVAVGFPTTRRYHFIHVIDRKGESRFALNEEVERAGDDYALTSVARQAGDRQLVWVAFDRRPTIAAAAHLQRWIYDGQTLLGLATVPLCAAAALFAVGIWFTARRDLEALRARRQGVRRRGPELLPSVATFNAKVKSRRWRGDQGIGIQQGDGAITRLNLRGGLRLPPGAQYQHIAMFGAPGAGKSSLYRQLLLQARARGERAVVWDAAMEWTREFYDPEHGDQIITPNDIRSPYWALGDEITTPFDADTLAEAFFPFKPRANDFFIDSPRQICAYLLRFKPTAAQLRIWLGDENQLDRILNEHQEGRELAHFVSKRAPAQRGGVLASLNAIAKSLALVPDEADTTHRWSTAAWAKQDRGWLFISSTPMTRSRLTPLLSAWIDMLILRTMTRPDQRTDRPPVPVWFMLDEFASLHRLQQAQVALAEGRKSRNPIVLGLQSRAQLDAIYGQLADGMVACTGTQVYFRTPEPNTAEWVSKAFGQIETDRVRQSWSQEAGVLGRTRRTDSLDSRFEPLVMASRVSSLSNMECLVKFNEVAVRVQIPYLQLPPQAPDFLARPDAPLLVAPPAATAATAFEWIS